MPSKSQPDKRTNGEVVGVDGSDVDNNLQNRDEDRQEKRQKVVVVGLGMVAISFM